MWKKIKAFFKKYWGIIAGAVLFVVGFIVGKFTGRTTADFDKLRANNDQLAKQIHDLGGLLGQSENLSRLNEIELARLRADLANANQLLKSSKTAIAGGKSDVTGLTETNKRLADWIRKYGKPVANIQGAE